MNQRRNLLVAGLALLLVAAPAQKAEAQVSFGPQLVLFDFERLGVGARLDFGLADVLGIEEGFFQGLFGSANGNYIFGESQDFGDESVSWNGTTINLNALVPFSVEAAVSPYAGAGINHTRFSTDVSGTSFPGFGFTGSSSGLNLVGGFGFGLGDLPAFAELQYSTSGAGYVTISAGVLFGG